MSGPRLLSVGRSLTGAVLVSFVGLMAAGCQDGPPQEPASAAASETTFAAQAAAVRNGESEQIRLDTLAVNDDDLATLSGLEDRLVRLNLSHTQISDAGLAQIAGMRRLVQLRLASPQISDAGLAALAELAELRHLHLIDAPLGDAGLEQLERLKQLESLYLDGIVASDAACARLVEALPGVHLHFDGDHHRRDPQRDDSHD